MYPYAACMYPYVTLKFLVCIHLVKAKLMCLKTINIDEIWLCTTFPTPGSHLYARTHRQSLILNLNFEAAAFDDALSLRKFSLSHLMKENPIQSWILDSRYWHGFWSWQWNLDSGF